MNSPIQAPDVGEIFEYGRPNLYSFSHRYRVTGWMRAKPWVANDYEKALTGALEGEHNPFWIDFYSEQVILGQRMVWCKREEATHVTGAGVSGCIAPLTKIKVIGRVRWSEEDIDRERRWALTLAERGDCHI